MGGECQCEDGFDGWYCEISCENIEQVIATRIGTDDESVILDELYGKYHKCYSELLNRMNAESANVDDCGDCDVDCVNIELVLTTDQYPEETSFSLVNFPSTTL